MGFATSDELDRLAIPHATVEVQDLDDAVAVSCRVAREKTAARFVVGLPLNMDGSRGDMAKEVEEFVRRLGERSGLPVNVWDERLSSGLVDRMLVDADVSRNRRKQVRDKLAAQVILQGYLDSKCHETLESNR